MRCILMLPHSAAVQVLIHTVLGKHLDALLENAAALDTMTLQTSVPSSVEAAAATEAPPSVGASSSLLVGFRNFLSSNGK